MKTVTKVVSFMWFIAAILLCFETSIVWLRTSFVVASCMVILLLVENDRTQTLLEKK